MELFWLLLWKHTNTCWRKEKIDVRVLSHDICILASFLLCFAFWSGESCTRTWKWGGSELLGHPTSFVELRVAFLPSMVLGLISDFIFFPGCGGLKKIGGFEFWHFSAAAWEKLKCLWSGSKPVHVERVGGGTKLKNIAMWFGCLQLH